MALPVTLHKEDSIGLVIIDNPPVNALSQAVRQGLVECLDAALGDDDVEAIVIACEGRTFIAGADISEFDKPPLEPHLPDVLRRLDEASKPIIAALHGTTLGGGFETALACHYRVASRGTKVGFPEVTLGLIPGAGGTQRLPRIVDVETALDMITSGKPRRVEDLSGIVDRIVDDGLREATRSFAQALLEAPESRTVSISGREVDKPADQEGLFRQWREKIAKKYRGQISPRCCIDAIENALLLPFEEGLKKEREMFLECRGSEQSRALRHAFFAEREAVRADEYAEEPVEIRSAGIVGAGTMGSGIALCLAAAGIPVVLLEADWDNLQRGLDAIHSRLDRNVKQGRINEAQSRERRDLIRGTCDYADLGDVDLVIEAAFENMQVKQEIFSRLGEITREDAILATNTSYLDINRIADAVIHPERVLGMHFFSPADVMKLLEVVRADRTDDRSMATVITMGKRIGKIPVPVGHCYGFAGNRMYACYGREGQMLLLEGATPVQIDAAMENWGMAMGPMSVLDMSGLDISYKARKQNPDRPEDPLYFRPADMLVEMDRIGRKSGAGFYRYDLKTGDKHEDPEVTELIRREAGSLGVEQRTISEEEIQNRMIDALINEGARILEEDIARSAGDLDVIWINGYGFPRYRGGPMFYARQTGLDRALQRIEGYRERFGDHYWKPSEFLKRSANAGEWEK
ncbi:MAG: 3-hydroxyacyl-CoA dehydrogenase NAD-binding domain-containing protein [Gammaproteobacteria bacterium]